MMKRLFKCNGNWNHRYIVLQWWVGFDIEWDLIVIEYVCTVTKSWNAAGTFILQNIFDLCICVCWNGQSGRLRSILHSIHNFILDQLQQGSMMRFLESSTALSNMINALIRCLLKTSVYLSMLVWGLMFFNVLAQFCWPGQRQSVANLSHACPHIWSIPGMCVAQGAANTCRPT